MENEGKTGSFFSKLFGKKTNDVPSFKMKKYIDETTGLLNEKQEPLAIAAEFDSIVDIANAGNADAQFVVGQLYYEGYGIEQDFPNAVVAYQKAANQGQAYAQLGLGRCYDYGKGVEKDLAKAVKYYYQAAQQGIPRAMKFLADYYYNGIGVQKSLSSAVDWYKKAAKKR